ncbi:uncharacterized protein BDZ83DRAFT_606948 [Colletotrichum acutatum]|uniref:Uncharacterized protein n=1 Tax=Glomerella acutata TaxID=27357 RepID=A0AAD9CZ64_GLOAC|nr:uncharacterized protein BDZ83DRAFT_606948 [Colletotrichum acutatum]KAK1729158.1 hypothetical protein BDZ83DRAFT_606948 [Colletotrichum acutatum]
MVSPHLSQQMKPRQQQTASHQEQSSQADRVDTRYLPDFQHPSQNLPDPPTSLAPRAGHRRLWSGRVVHHRHVNHAPKGKSTDHVSMARHINQSIDHDFTTHNFASSRYFGSRATPSQGDFTLNCMCGVPVFPQVQFFNNDG